MELSKEEEKSIINLKKYIEEDDFFNGKSKIESDFDKFCYEHCKDIHNVLLLVQKQKNEIQKMTAQKIFIIGLRNGKNLIQKNIERAREFEILTKMVDEMAGEIAYLNYETIGDWCKGDQCKKFKMKENHQRECDTTNHDCIKQYFREKVRE